MNLLRRHFFSALFIVAGIVLLSMNHGMVIRGTGEGGKGVDFGWLVLGIGVVSLLWDFVKAKREKRQEPPAPPPPKAP